MIQIMLGNIDNLCNETCHWIELFISHFLYVRPLTVVMPNYDIYGCLKKKKNISGPHIFMNLCTYRPFVMHYSWPDTEAGN